MPPSRLLLIDDHAMFRAGLAVLLRMSVEGLQVDEADSVVEATSKSLPKPDLVLLDIVLKGLSGLEGMGPIRKRWPGVPIVMVSSDSEPQTIQQALLNGAWAFVPKENSADKVVQVVQQALREVHSVAEVQPKHPAAAEAGASLTPRQLEVLDLLSKGMTNKAIGRKLALSENTVRWHVQSILALLRVTNRSEAAFAARNQGLIR